MHEKNSAVRIKPIVKNIGLNNKSFSSEEKKHISCIFIDQLCNLRKKQIVFDFFCRYFEPVEIFTECTCIVVYCSGSILGRDKSLKIQQIDILLSIIQYI